VTPVTTVTPVIAPVAAKAEEKNLNIQKLNKFNGKENLTSFLSHFDVCTRINKWDAEQQYLRLMASLDELALNILWDGQRV
jgi:hypothetical protein